MGDEPEDVRTIKQKLLFYTTAFFILLGTFSLFAFLFLVPFVIDPAFTTIFMQFDETPALCLTIESLHLSGAKNCSAASCREGCTKDVYNCTQIRVNYRKFVDTEELNDFVNRSRILEAAQMKKEAEEEAERIRKIRKWRRSIRGYDYGEEGKIIVDDNLSDDDNNNDDDDDDEDDDNNNNNNQNDIDSLIGISDIKLTGLMGNNSEWYFIGARLFPNVKGCGYPPMLNCTIWDKKFGIEGTNYTCYYSRIDPGLVITDLDMWQNTLNLVYAMAIPIPSFIISVIYLTFAYFKIYNEDEESAPLDKNAEGMAGGEDDDENDENDDVCVDIVIPNGATPLSASGPLTPNSDINSFGHQLKVKMADEMSRESLDAGIISNSGSLQGNLSKTMTTSISTPPGPTAAV